MVTPVFVRMTAFGRPPNASVIGVDRVAFVERTTGIAIAIPRAIPVLFYAPVPHAALQQPSARSKACSTRWYAFGYEDEEAWRTDADPEIG